jgi:hypothetical protein
MARPALHRCCVLRLFDRLSRRASNGWSPITLWPKGKRMFACKAPLTSWLRAVRSPCLSGTSQHGPRLLDKKSGGSPAETHGVVGMNRRAESDPNKPATARRSDRAAIAARDPAPRAVNRPGFDLGGAVGDAKPKKGRPARKGAAARVKRKSKRTSKAAGKMQSLFGGD